MHGKFSFYIEQNEIVRRVEKLFALADSLEAKYEKALEKIDKLEQSILSKAFLGELVESDPKDEPAEKLLEKIFSNRGRWFQNDLTKQDKRDRFYLCQVLTRDRFSHLLCFQ